MATRTAKSQLVPRLKIIDTKFRRQRKHNFLAVPGLLSFPTKTDSPRSIMNSNAGKQSMVLINTQKPYVNTNFEDMMGNASVYRRIAEDDFVVLKKIKKFDRIDCDLQPYYMFIQYLDSGEIDVIERTDVQNLSEKYGFQYINDFIDSLEEGMHVKKDTTLYHPTSYDKFGNYGTGQNVLFAYQADAYTMEDSISVTKSFADNYTSMEVEEVVVSLNDNNALINRYGDADNYKAWPDIGENTEHKILCTRRIINRREMYYAFKSSNIKRSLNMDKSFSCEGTVVDIDIYCNKPRGEIRDVDYNKQFLFYLDMIQRFRTNVYEYTSELLKQFPCTDQVKWINNRMGKLIDPNTKIKDAANREFGFAKVYFTVKRMVGIHRGQKLTGRYGNKGVTSRIVPDYQALHLATGEVIQVVLNPLGVVNRLNIMQLFEQSITFRSRRVLERMRETPSLKEKEKLLFPFIRIFNEKQADTFEKKYRALESTKLRKEFMDDTETYGIFITIPPFWQDKELYDCIMECEEKFPWIEPYDVYFYNETSKRWVKQMAKQPIGSMYMVKMKQTSMRGMSARATGPINQRGVPDKSHDAKDHVTTIANGAVRLGTQEGNIYNTSVGSHILAAESMMYRSSPKARRELGKKQETSKFGIVEDFEFTDQMTNRNVETLNCKLLSMGLELAFEEDVLDFSPGDEIKEHTYKGTKYICTTNEMRKILATDIVQEELNNGTISILGTEDDRDTFMNNLACRISSSVEHMLYA